MRNSASVSDGVLIPIEFPMCHAKGANLRTIMGTVKSCEFVFCAAFQEKQISCGNALELSSKGHYFPKLQRKALFLWWFGAALAQLVRALDCGSRGPPFNSGRQYHFLDKKIITQQCPQLFD